MKYLIIKNNKINGACTVPIATNNNTITVEISDEMYNAYLAEPLTFIYADSQVVANPNKEQEIADRTSQEDYINKSRLRMTKLDFYQYVCKPKNITYVALKEGLAQNIELRAAWDLCNHVYRYSTSMTDGGIQLLCTLSGQDINTIDLVAFNAELDGIFQAHCASD